MRSSTWIVVALGIMMSGCGVSLTEGGARVSVAQTDPPASCREIGMVTGTSTSNFIRAASAYEDSEADLRNNAALEGATFVRYEAIGGHKNTIQIAGTAYVCNAPRVER